MDVRIVDFEETKVAVVEYRGAPELEYEAVRKLVKWKLENALTDTTRYRMFGLHYSDPKTTPSNEYRVDFCLSVDFEVGENQYGIRNGSIPKLRCAFARDIGSRHDNKAAAYLVEQWLPTGNERMGDHPVIFHYVNVGPTVKPEEMITDVYLPLA